MFQAVTGNPNAQIGPPRGLLGAGRGSGSEDDDDEVVVDSDEVAIGSEEDMIVLLRSWGPSKPTQISLYLSTRFTGEGVAAM